MTEIVYIFEYLVRQCKDCNKQNQLKRRCCHMTVVAAFSNMTKTANYNISKAVRPLSKTANYNMGKALREINITLQKH